MSLWDDCLYDDRREKDESENDYYDDVRLQREREEEEEKERTLQRLYWEESDRMMHEALKEDGEED